jgi:hypothetical protein
MFHVEQWTQTDLSFHVEHFLSMQMKAATRRLAQRSTWNSSSLLGPISQSE